MAGIIECIPNFSEGRNPAVVDEIVTAIKSSPGVKVLHVDSGHSANRTVVTFAGNPESVIEGAFRGIRKASQLIDMQAQTGTHPRMGVTDVCPFVPVSGISFEELVPMVDKLAGRVGEELNIPVYLYEKSARHPIRKNLATIRSGEYEGFREKINLPDWKPDFGPQAFNPRSGQTVMGVRDFLIAYNVNLNTTDLDVANEIARDVRESGRIIVREGKKIRQPGTCKAVKAIGWFMAEYGCAQVSTNLTDIHLTPVHKAFEAIREAARQRGVAVTGSELIGLIPKQCLVEAGEYYGNGELGEKAQVQLAVERLGLDDLSPFDPQQRVLEYLLENP